MVYYVVVLYKDEQELHHKFTSRHDADEYIFHHKLHAYISAHSTEHDRLSVSPHEKINQLGLDKPN